MAVAESHSKRPTCPSCSKPSRLCLCTRIQNPGGIDNKVSVTILQHSKETKHPLNSVRIAKLGLSNLTVVTVSDVNFGAQFVIRLIESDGVPDRNQTQKRKLEDIGGLISGKENMGEGCAKCSKEKGCNLGDAKGEFNSAHDSDLLESCGLVLGTEYESRSNECISANSSFSAEIHSTLNEAVMANSFDVEHVLRGAEEPVICATIGKHGVISHLESKWKPFQTEAQERPNFDQFLGSQLAVDALAKGFMVKKLQKRKLKESMNLEEYEEFELVVPPGSVLLYPSDTAVGADDLQAMNIGVKNLIVLDGTWAKAKRVYKENPWLRLLPHLKLVLDKLSLFSEVRRQPKAGCLSTIESIVYALKAVGDNPEGLDNLLDVFESMVGDQRRCKDESLQSDH
ncbi:hypothetical protein GH714_007725 [Hevea brasiliensis]|uniref:tRNA-uridine aminocarboxypropyltransferase n=1 Tax=Hevea brasiliensis TaxID=3981 RepID=A0A6A6KE35_HEVBR|nr:hypothetical protein GH714_007725 [Hevea brasiliensis]